MAAAVAGQATWLHIGLMGVSRGPPLGVFAVAPPSQTHAARGSAAKAVASVIKWVTLTVLATFTTVDAYSDYFNALHHIPSTT